MNKIAVIAWVLVPLVAAGSLTTLQGAPANSSYQSMGVETGAARDAQISEILIGMWSPDRREKLTLGGTTTYRPDGTGTEVIWMVAHPERQMRVEFLWSVSSGLLTLRMGKASNWPPGYPLPPKLVDKIISISNTEMVAELVEGYSKEMIGKREIKIRAD